VEDKALSAPLADRYAGWQQEGAQHMLAGKRSLEEIAQWVEGADLNPNPKSGRQEMLENIVNRYVG